MSSPEEIPNIEQFPLQPISRPRVETIPDPDIERQSPIRSLSPLVRANVEFWHSGEEESQVIKQQVAYKQNGYDHARRADRAGIAMAFLALVIIGLLVVILFLNSRRNGSAPPSDTKPTTGPTIDFYQGNRAFDRKVKLEKSGIMATDLPIEGVTEDLEISLQAQMASMKEKLEKMRTQKIVEEPPVPMVERTSAPATVLGVRPSQMGKFNSPSEFDTILPKSLQGVK